MAPMRLRVLAAMACFSAILLHAIEAKELTIDEASKEVFTPTEDQFSPYDVQEPFKIAAINYIWSKIKKRQDQNAQKTIFVQLQSFDNELNDLQLRKGIELHVEEAGTKSRRTYEGVEGALRAYLRDRGAEEVLNAVIAKYLKFDHETPLLLGKEEYQTLKADRKAQRQAIKLKILGMFSNKNLNKLYLQAYEAGFSDEELQQLAASFHDYEVRLNEHRARLTRHAAKLHQAENSVLDDHSQQRKIEETLKAANEQLNRELSEYEAKIANASSVLMATNERVERIWQHVQNSRLSSVEKTKIRAELDNYQRKIAKMQWVQKEHGEVQQQDVHLEDAMQKFDVEKAQRKLKEQSARLDKYEAYIEQRIATMSHDEL